ncbi:vitamin K epoxide reductase family protein [Streptomyces silvisoli]|uniref:Vitamin K epoxide reductase family protein n=1 Tax=Streptomyces silvisoli TaxID=3034235 RepID=A0ABT5ZGE0_9ACTN|nr:vitamin K epoxide reductase family protein [Streptomyces silvisoli]MDF3288892.1 vitamin K epoxide reductase family protein [Streptomyces silvisoli]
MTTSALDETRSDERQETAGLIGASRAFSVLLVVCGALGLLAAWVITIDKFELLKNPNFVPGCSLNPIISCGNIMKSAQASAFGFPNPMIGLVAYPVMMCVGMGVLAGARYRPWFWLGLQAGTLFGVGFVTWLQYESLYSIGSLCLWCSLAWVVTIAAFWYTLVHNIKHRVIPVPRGLRSAALEFHWAVPVLWYGVIIMLILTRWWSYWSTLI